MSDRWLIVLFVVTGVAWPALAAPGAKKIDRLVEAEKSDKAWSLCARELAKGEMDADPELREACAAARLAWLMTANPAGLSVPNLEEFWTSWDGTIAAAGAREMAARSLVGDAGDNRELLFEVGVEFPETTAGTEAIGRIWQLALDDGTSASALRFAETFPDAPQAADARVRASQLAFGEAAKDGSSGAWQTFLDRWPGHERHAEGTGRWHEALFAEAEADDSSAGWRAFLDNWPDHPRFADAEERWHGSQFREAKEAGPLALLALATGYPDHPKALKARELAQRRSAQVFLAASRAGTFWPLTLAERPPERSVPIEFDAIRVQRPKDGDAPRARLVLMRDGEELAITRFAEVLAEHGFPAELAPESYRPLWGADVDGSLEGQGVKPLCQPDGEETWFAVVVDVSGPSQTFPFRVPTLCRDLGSPFDPASSLELAGQEVTFGQGRREFLDLFPGFTAQRFGDPNTQCRASDPWPQVCALFYRGLLYGLFLERAGDGAITAAERELGGPLRGQLTGLTVHHLPSDATGVTHHRSSSLWAWDQYWVSAETGDPAGETRVVHPGLVAFVRRTIPDFELAHFPDF